MYFYQNSWVALLSGWSVFRSLPNPTGPKSHRCYPSGEECEVLKVWILLRDGWRSPWRSFFKIRYQPFCPNLLKQRLNHKTPSCFFHVFLLEFGIFFACLADAPMLDLSVSITTPRSWWFLGFHPSPMVPWLGRCPVAALVENENFSWHLLSSCFCDSNGWYMFFRKNNNKSKTSYAKELKLRYIVISTQTRWVTAFPRLFLHAHRFESLTSTASSHHAGTMALQLRIRKENTFQISCAVKKMIPQLHDCPYLDSYFTLTKKIRKEHIAERTWTFTSFLFFYQSSEKRHSVAMRGHGCHRYQLLPVIEICAAGACAVREPLWRQTWWKLPCKITISHRKKDGVFQGPTATEQPTKKSKLPRWTEGCAFFLTTGAQQHVKMLSLGLTFFE